MGLGIRSFLICDFDETITSLDTGVLILDQFATGDWRTFDRLYDLNQMPIEDVMRRQFSMVKASKSEMIRAIEGSVSFRPGFKELVEVCDRAGFRLMVASYGLDFCINHLLDSAGIRRRVEVWAPKTRLTANGIEFTFPRLRLKDSVNLKDDLVRDCKRRGRRVVFVGDGTSDFPAASNADARFAIKGSKLSEICDKLGVHYVPITDFHPVIESVQATVPIVRGQDVS